MGLLAHKRLVKTEERSDTGDQGHVRTRGSVGSWMGIRMLAEKTGEILVKSVFSLIALHQY